MIERSGLELTVTVPAELLGISRSSGVHGIRDRSTCAGRHADRCSVPRVGRAWPE